MEKEFWEDGESWIGDQLEKQHMVMATWKGDENMIEVLLFAHLQEGASKPAFAYRL